MASGPDNYDRCCWDKHQRHERDDSCPAHPKPPAGSQCSASGPDNFDRCCWDKHQRHERDDSCPAHPKPPHGAPCSARGPSSSQAFKDCCRQQGDWDSSCWKHHRRALRSAAPDHAQPASAAAARQCADLPLPQFLACCDTRPDATCLVPVQALLHRRRLRMFEAVMCDGAGRVGSPAHQRCCWRKQQRGEQDATC